MKNKTILARIRMIWEWLRCPSNRAIRRRIYFHQVKKVDGFPLEHIARRAQMVISRPRHERRIVLKLLTSQYNFTHLDSEYLNKVLSFLK